MAVEFAHSNQVKIVSVSNALFLREEMSKD